MTEPKQSLVGTLKSLCFLHWTEIKDGHHIQDLYFNSGPNLKINNIFFLEAINMIDP